MNQQDFFSSYFISQDLLDRHIKEGMITIYDEGVRILSKSLTGGFKISLGDSSSSRVGENITPINLPMKYSLECPLIADDKTDNISDEDDNEKKILREFPEIGFRRVGYYFYGDIPDTTKGICILTEGLGNYLRLQQEYGDEALVLGIPYKGNWQGAYSFLKQHYNLINIVRGKWISVNVVLYRCLGAESFFGGVSNIRMYTPSSPLKHSYVHDNKRHGEAVRPFKDFLFRCRTVDRYLPEVFDENKLAFGCGYKIGKKNGVTYIYDNIAQYIIHIHSLREYMGSVYCYNYDKFLRQELSPKELKKKIKDSLKHYFKITNVLSANIEEVFKLIKINLSDLKQSPDTDYCIALEDIVIHVKDGKHIKHHRTNGTLSMFPYKYESIMQQGPPKLFIQMLQKILKGNDHIDEHIRFLQEAFGYALISESNLNLGIFLFGSGSNGKGSILRILQAVYGSINCSAYSLSSFNNPNVLRGMIGKMVNIDFDASFDTLLDRSEIKKVISGETIEVKSLYKDITTTELQVNLFAGSNIMPKIRQRDNSVSRRRVFIHCKQNFEGPDKDAYIEERTLKQEKEQIFGWMLEGLIRVMKNGKIYKPKHLTESFSQTLEDLDGVQQFIEDWCDVGDQYRTRGKVLYEHYLKYAKSIYGYMSLSDFYHQLELKNFTQRRVANKRGYQGLRIKGDF